MKKQIKIPGVLICLLVLTLVLALYYSFFYTGLSQKTAQLSAQHATDMQQLSAYREMAANKPALMKSIEDLKQQAEASGSELGIPPLRSARRPSNRSFERGGDRNGHHDERYFCGKENTIRAHPVAGGGNNHCRLHGTAA